MKQYDVYKPNSSNTGCAFSFKIVEKDKDQNPMKPSFLIQSIRQASWDSKKRTGSFKANASDKEKNIHVKLGVNEVGGMLHAIENYTEFSAFHSYNDDKTQILFKPYLKKDKTKAFSFTIVKNSSLRFGMGVELSEARVMKGFFELFLNKFFNY